MYVVVTFVIITKFIEHTNSRVRSASVARWETFLAGKGKEVSFETAFERISTCSFNTHCELVPIQPPTLSEMGNEQ